MLSFNLESKQPLLQLPFTNKFFNIELTITSKNLLKYELLSNNINTKMTQPNENETIYHFELLNTEHNKIYFTIPCKDVITWKLRILNDEKRNFNLTFTPDYLEIIHNFKKENEALLNRNKQSQKNA